MSKIALCLTHKSIEENLNELYKYESFIDIGELRVDCLYEKYTNPGKSSYIEKLVEASPVPLILTVRRKADGGFWIQSERERLELIESLVGLGFKYVDLEDDLTLCSQQELLYKISEKVQKANIRIIRSFHDFSGIPKDLVKRIRDNSQRGELPKAAVTLNHSRDIIPFMEAVKELEGVEKILLAMGERGFFSRILTHKLGSFLTFTSPLNGLKAAAGQIDPETLSHIYRGGKHEKNDPLYGIIGNPVIQSRSPELHNGWLEKKQLSGIYIPFLLDDMEDFSSIEKFFSFRGLSVTIPFKEKILPFLDRKSEAVKAIGACNTFYRKNGKVCGENSDALGFLYPLLDSLGLDRQSKKPLEGYKCALIGAGGASRGVLFALVNRGAKVLILNRTLSSAEKLAREFGAEAGVLSPDSLSLLRQYNQVIVQTTSLGMAPLEDKDPLSFYDFTGKEFVYDIIYKPAETVFMKRAIDAGCTVLGGWEMLREQGKIQFELFTGESLTFK